jgi:hypothetical protein
MGIFLDITKVFDVINHNLLLSKLELYGLRGKMHEWMSSYLKDRTQFVEIQHVGQMTSNLNTFTTSLRAITHGSVLGPLLLLLCVNDLPQALQQASVVLFADDSNILLTDNKLVSLNENI